MNEYYQGKVVVVTGAAGFLGSNLVDQLLASGATVIGVDNFLTGRKENLAHLLEGAGNPAFSFITADVITSPAGYLGEGTHPDLIFHLASPASPPRYQAHPVETYLVNSLGTHQLLDYLRNINPQGRLIYASTSEIYGDPAVHPQPETYWGNVNPNGLRSCYDESKRLGETICGVFQREYTLDVRIMRIFNTYGPRMDPQDGRVIPNFILQALHHEPMTVYGDGQQTRSYCYVDDLIDGMIRLGAAPGLSGETINLGNPEEYTVQQTARIIAATQGVEVEFTHQALPQDDPRQRRPDISKAQQLLNWQPATAFETGLQKTITYFQQ